MADIKFVIDVDGVEKVVKLRTETDKVKTSAKTAGDKLDGLSRKVGRFGNTTNGARKNTNRMNAAIQNAGYQFGDFFVQVQSGQNALVAFSQQGTQLLGILPGVAGAVGGLAVVLGSQLALALTRNSDLFKSFSEIVKDAESAISGFTGISRKIATAMKDELSPAVLEAYKVLGEARIEQAINRTDAALEKTLKKSEAEVKTLNNQIKGTEDLLKRVYTAIEDNAELSFFDVRNVGELEQQLVDLKAQLADVEIDTIFSEVSNLDFNNVEDLSQAMLVIAERAKLLAESGRISQDRFEELEGLTFAIAEQIDLINDRNKQQVESTGRILDYNKELLAVERERASLAESIEQTFERTARQAKLMQEGMDRGVAGQVASMEMRIAKERELLIQLENAGEVSPGTALSTSVTRQQQLEQYTADLTGMAAKKASSATEQLTDAQKALQDYGDKLDQIRLQVSGEFAGTMIDAFREVADGTKTVGQAFGDMAEQIIRQILDLLIYQPLLRSLTNALVPGMGSSVFGAATQALAGPKPLPGVPAGGSVRGSYKFANGGVVNSPTMFGMSGGRTGLMGEAGPEAILPLKRGAGGKLGVEGGGNVTVNQNFNFAANGDESVKRIIAEAAPGIAKMTEAQIVNSRQRGGQMRRVFS